MRAPELTSRSPSPQTTPNFGTAALGRRATAITDRHRSKLAIVYVRQSSTPQVFDHRESRERQYALAVLGEPTAVGMIVILVVSPNLLQPRVFLWLESFGQLRGRSTIVESGAGDHHRQQQAQDIHQNMAFSAADLLAAVVAVFAAHFG